MTVDTFLKWLGEVVAVGGSSAVIAFGLFRWLGQKWIEQRLSIRLEGFKSEQQRELEKLRQFLSGRISRIHEKEFEVLPKAWFMLHEAHGTAGHAVAAFKSQPNFSNLAPAQFEEFLTVSRLSAYQKDALRAATDRQAYFRDAMAGIELDDAKEKQRIFHNYLIEHRIFMTDDLREKFGAVDSDLSSGLTEYDIGKDSKDWEMQSSAIKKVIGLKAKIDELYQRFARERQVLQRSQHGGVSRRGSAKV